MTIQEAAYQILKEFGNPLSSKDIASKAIERNMVTSAAKDPNQSLAQTIEKNIREGTYNEPELIFIQTSQERLIGLPGWGSVTPFTENNPKKDLIELRVQIAIELMEKIKLAEQAKLKNTFNETVSLILNNGISSLSTEIKKGLMEKLESL